MLFERNEVYLPDETFALTFADSTDFFAIAANESVLAANVLLSPALSMTDLGTASLSPNSVVTSWKSFMTLSTRHIQNEIKVRSKGN